MILSLAAFTNLASPLFRKTQSVAKHVICSVNAGTVTVSGHALQDTMIRFWGYEGHVLMSYPSGQCSPRQAVTLGDHFIHENTLWLYLRERRAGQLVQEASKL